MLDASSPNSSAIQAQAPAMISAFVFGFMHVMTAILSGNISEWVQIFSYFFMGMALSFLYEKRNNIFVPVLTHSMNNLISMLLIFL